MRTHYLIIAITALVTFMTYIIDGNILYGNAGIIDGLINETDLKSYQLSIYKISNWSGFGEFTTLRLLIGAFLLSFYLILSNRWILLASITMWISYWTVCNSGIGYTYGADYFMIFLLYFNVLICLCETLKIRDRKKYLLYLLQSHLCLVYIFAGLGKAVGIDWWNGNALWYVANVFSSDGIKMIFSWFLSTSIIFKILSFGTVILELFYPVLIFNKRTRKLTLILVILMHVGIGVILKLYSFGFVMIVMNLLAFGHYLNKEYSFVSNTIETVFQRKLQLMKHKYA